MAPQLDDRTLRSVNYRLKNTPVEQLPRVLQHILSQLVAGKCNLSSNHPEATWLKTRLGSLLQDRTQEARFCAAVLVKAVLDLGGSNAMVEDKERIRGWIRGLLDILKRPGLATTKKCAIVAVTKAFMLTWDHATLVRELTTPTLPTFITICLQHFQGTPQIRTPLQVELIEFVLESFAQLLPRHPTVFRSFASQIKTLATAALCNDPFDSETVAILSPQVEHAASQVLVLLHQCAQKGGGAVEWEHAVGDLISVTHATLDQVFRAVTEEWQSVAGVRSTVNASGELEEEPQMDADEQSGFPSWSGLRSGAERIQSLLEFLQAYLRAPTTASVKIPLGRIVDLCTRLLYVQAPRSQDPVGNRYNALVSREEREELLALLPEIHVSTLETANTILERLGPASMPMCLHILDLITWLFQAEHLDANIRAATYQCVAKILSIAGPTFGKATVRSLDEIIRSCCEDLLPMHEAPKISEVINPQLTNNPKSGKGSNGAASSTNTLSALVIALPGLYEAASDLLPILFSKLPADLVSKAARTKMDRTAILINHTDALAASVLNPAPQKASLLPFLSALAPESPVTEAILRPRMPVILGGKQEDTDSPTAEDDETGEQEGQETLEFADALHSAEELHTTSGRATVATNSKPTESQTPWPTGDSARVKSNETQQTTLAAELATIPAKRSVEEQVPLSSPKRPRTEDEQAPTTQAAVVVEETTIPADAVPMQTTLKTAMAGAGAESDDEDESDFEIPPLVMSTVFDDENEESE